MGFLYQCSINLTSPTIRHMVYSIMVLLILYGRKRLFGLINTLSTIFQFVTNNKPIKDMPTIVSGSKFWGSTEVILWRARPQETVILLHITYKSSCNGITSMFTLPISRNGITSMFILSISLGLSLFFTKMNR